MKLTKSVKTAIVGLLAHKSRSALTILGIVIGIAAIMLIASVGSGAENLILGQIESLGSNVIVVIPGKEPTGPTDPAATESLFSDSLKQREFDALSDKSNVPSGRIYEILEELNENLQVGEHPRDLTSEEIKVLMECVGKA